MTKYCKRCDTTKIISEFNTRKGAKGKADGLQAYCKVCMKEYLRERYTATRETYARKMVERRKSIRHQFSQLKSTLCCKTCPENHPATLDFHHRDPTEKTICVADAVSYGWGMESILAEIEKCDVLCSNCHRKSHYVV